MRLGSRFAFRLPRPDILRQSLVQSRGDYGDVKPVGENVSELRFHFGPGYRIYFTERLGILFFLLAGGTKKTQQEDIKLAKLIAAQI